MDDSRFEHEQKVALEDELKRLNSFVNDYTPKGYLLPIGKFHSQYITFDIFNTYHDDIERYPEKVFNNPIVAEAVYHFYIRKELEKENQNFKKDIQNEIKQQMNANNKKIVERVLIGRIKKLQDSGLFEGGKKDWIVEIIKAVGEIY